MHYLLVLLAGSIAWTATSVPTLADDGWPLKIHPPSFSNCGDADRELREAVYPDDMAGAYICKGQYALALYAIEEMFNQARTPQKKDYCINLRNEVYKKMREEDAHVAVPPPQSPPRPEPPKAETVVVTGTGFIIDDRGDVVTNNHVVDGCSRISFGLNGQGLVQGRLIASDGTNDLAVANFPLPHTRVASFSNTTNSRPGDDLVVFGYPLVGFLSTSGNLTRGSLTAMAGLQDDVRYMQISAPIQPGNSGGPVLGMGGEVIGVVTYKLNALETMKRAGGDIPQNVNFALKASILRLFLDSHSIPYTVSDHSVSLAPAEVGDLSEQFTGIVVCAKSAQAAPPRQAVPPTKTAYVVQVASKENQTEALVTFADMQRKYPTLLATYRPMVTKVDLGAKGVWYRLRIGPIPDKETAPSRILALN
jgi:S1-C subfamily serine protease